ncbi:MAG: DUF1566 domain-containing protein [Verrucomicrobia bacterium]|nr:DUF1566 domain-containing protein [Verrucomicrobiota bacterium]
MRRTASMLAVVLGLGADTFGAERPYVVVGTGQTKCYDNQREIPPPKPGQPFYGQDAQYRFVQPAYKLSADGLTVHDQNTGLIWQRSPDTDGDGALTRKDKLTLVQAEALPAKLNAARFGGCSDWRLPTIKELYSLMNFSGTDPSGPGTDTSRLTPFIDTKFFKFAYGDTRTGERVIDSQYASCTKYVGKSFRGFNKLFGLNLADGRIKGYDLKMPGGFEEKTFFVQCVRGNPGYGKNDFRDNSDGTITDRATGLMWSKRDSGRGMNWEAALAWAQAKNTEKYLGHNDWRLPNAKELQSIVDYTRAPDATGTPAIDPVFDCTRITNEIGQADWPYYWTGTTHGHLLGGGAAIYIAFGRAAGWPSGPPGKGGGLGRGGFGKGPPERGGPPASGPRAGGPGAGGAASSRSPQFTDVHGAGSQRSDPKAGNPAEFPHGRGPQGDVIRINNFVRLVRDADGSIRTR